jgi:hypothetical protein
MEGGGVRGEPWFPGVPCKREGASGGTVGSPDL